MNYAEYESKINRVIKQLDDLFETANYLIPYNLSMSDSLLIQAAEKTRELLILTEDAGFDGHTMEVDQITQIINALNIHFATKDYLYTSQETFDAFIKYQIANLV